jgi:hypothetical protein
MMNLVIIVIENIIIIVEQLVTDLPDQPDLPDL